MKKYFAFILLTALVSTTAYGQLRLSLQMGAEIPTGEFADAAATGFGFTGTFEYLLNQDVSLTASSGYNTWGPANDLPEGWDYNLSAIPVVVGLRYYLSRGDFHPYLGAEMGMYFLNFEITREVGDALLTYDRSETEFGFAPMFGFRYHVGPTVDLDFNVKYNLISTEENTTSYIGFNGGVQFGL